MAVLVSLVLALGGMLLAADAAGEWPQWRGPHLNGTSSTAKNLPVTWSQTENVKWRLELPQKSAATPIVWGDIVLITSAEKEFARPLKQLGFGVEARRRERAARKRSYGSNHMLLVAISRRDGTVKWTQRVGSGNRVHRKHNLTSPSPVTDGNHIWVLTGAGTLSCLDLEGNQVWQREIQQEYGYFGLNHGYASSPLLLNDRLYLQVLHGMKTDDPSYVFAVDKATGKTIWKVERPTDAESESPDNYSTPIVVEVKGKQQLVISGGDYVTGHDLASGREIWRMGGLNPNNNPAYRTIASSITTGGLVFTSSTRGRPFIAFRPGGSGDITQTNLVWKNNLGADVPTPTTDGKRIYIVRDNGVIGSFDAKTGQPIWKQQRIEPGTYSASPILADGKLYVSNEDGTTTVIKQSDEFEVLAVNKLGDYLLATPAPAGDEIFIRTRQYLYCIRNK